jgi:hypothetical protein
VLHGTQLHTRPADCLMHQRSPRFDTSLMFPDLDPPTRHPAAQHSVWHCLCLLVFLFSTLLHRTTALYSQAVVPNTLAFLATHFPYTAVRSLLDNQICALLHLSVPCTEMCVLYSAKNATHTPHFPPPRPSQLDSQSSASNTLPTASLDMLGTQALKALYHS